MSVLNNIKVFESKSDNRMPPGMSSRKGELGKGDEELETTLVKRTPRKLLKGGLRDRAPLSWLRILGRII